ncbi:MAG: O-antigen ligase family protein, partial [Flavobacteriaceae bacterium]|nr:O-antigen ligase family protein [Flavobacteriaceae bacterium]
FYAMRGLAMYQFLAIPLIILLFSKPKDLTLLFKIWGVLSILATLKGLQQYFFGVDAFEQQWLDSGAHRTHVLFGKLRIFSFYSDAGQFGGSQAHTALVFGIMTCLARLKKQTRIFYAIVMFMGLIGMIISGTRGAIAVPICGGGLLLVLSKNIKIITLGSVLGVIVYVFFAHTYIGQGNAEIRRMRTAFDSTAPSLQVRLENQRKLKGYLASRPFGGGVGSTGNWGKRFSPNTYLANIATDSWYVQIWADTGIIGLLYYLIMIGYFMFMACYNIMFKLKNKEFKIKIIALTCGVMGVLVASYGNGVFCQLPTSFLMFISLVFMVKSPEIEQQYCAK